MFTLMVTLSWTGWWKELNEIGYGHVVYQILPASSSSLSNPRQMSHWTSCLIFKNNSIATSPWCTFFNILAGTDPLNRMQLLSWFKTGNVPTQNLLVDDWRDFPSGKHDQMVPSKSLYVFGEHGIHIFWYELRIKEFSSFNPQQWMSEWANLIQLIRCNRRSHAVGCTR